MSKERLSAWFLRVVVTPVIVCASLALSPVGDLLVDFIYPPTECTCGMCDAEFVVIELVPRQEVVPRLGVVQHPEEIRLSSTDNLADESTR